MSSNSEVLMDRLMNLPSRIIRHHDLHILPQLVLHYLSHKDCFELEKAAYFADNPDFDHLLGAAGYCKHECNYKCAEDLWEDPSSYDDSGSAKFYKKIKKILQRSMKKHDVDLSSHEGIQKIALDLDIKNPQVISWDLKHGNHGVIIYENNEKLDKKLTDLFKKAVQFLGFCPI